MPSTAVPRRTDGRFTPTAATRMSSRTTVTSVWTVWSTPTAASTPDCWNTKTSTARRGWQPSTRTPARLHCTITWTLRISKTTCTFPGRCSVTERLCRKAESTLRTCRLFRLTARRPSGCRSASRKKERRRCFSTITGKKTPDRQSRKKMEKRHPVFHDL